MRRHGERQIYYFPGGEIIEDPLFQAAGGCPVTGSGAAKSSSGGSDTQWFKFDWLFDKNPSDTAWDGLVALGYAMNEEPPAVGVSPADPSVQAPDDSDIPAGYTYLGQFIAHELTFDATKGLQASPGLPQELRSPSLDLDSLYGCGPQDEQSSRMYDGDRLKVGQNSPSDTFALPPKKDDDHDLPREAKTEDDKTRYEAVIADPRNDENLPLAQTHLAFIKFHNQVVKYLDDNPDKQKNGKSLFEQARRLVVRHFQWIVLNDFLPRILDPDVLKSVRGGEIRCKKLLAVKSKDDLFMPVEFSAAAFRLGHSMVRGSYNFNAFHQSPDLHSLAPATLDQLFQFTQFSGDLGGKSLTTGKTLTGLRSDWVIDWRRFYDFPKPDDVGHNRAKKIDTSFSLHLNLITDYPHQVPEQYRAITVRNLIRGSILKLPTGQMLASNFDEKPMTPAMITCGATKDVLDALNKNSFHVKTPLWFYILKEAELFGEGNRLGPLGSRVVAETLFTIVKHSAHSIIGEPLSAEEMLPSREPDKFDMVDMLKFMGDVNPLGHYVT